MALSEREKLEIVETSERVRRAILTLHDETIMGDMQAPLNGWPSIVREATKGDYADAPRLRRFEPSPLDVDLMLPTLDWLTWLKNRPVYGNEWFRVVWARAYDTPWWKLSGRMGMSERSVQRRYDDAIIKLWGQFGRYDRHLVDKVSKMSDKLAHS